MYTLDPDYYPNQWKQKTDIYTYITTTIIIINNKTKQQNINTYTSWHYYYQELLQKIFAKNSHH